MATCVQTINSGTVQAETLSNNSPVVTLVNSNINGLYSLSSSMDQSIFLNVRMLNSYNTINLSLTIYKKDTMQIFGSMNITRTLVNSSFNILAGEYYICIRSLMLEYQVELTASFINYVTVQTLNPTTTYGFQSDSILTFKRIEVDCNKPLYYELIDGALPTGLIMLQNGYINGTLPMLDTDDYNKELPTSNTWYEKIHDNEYITAWGRVYRFKVYLYLEGGYSKGVDRWFYISILNDFNKNLKYVDQYMMLEDEKIVTFEEQIKLNTIKLCPDVCVDDTSSSIGNSSSNANSIINNSNNNSNSTNGNNANNNNNNGIGNANNNSASNDFISVIDGEVYKNVSEENKLYFEIESKFTLPDEKIINSSTDGVIKQGILRTEMILLDSKYIQFYNNEPQFPSEVGNNGLIEYYLENIKDLDNMVIVQLKDSCMFQSYLLENNVDGDIIDMDAYNRFDFCSIVIDYHKMDKKQYIRMMNNNGKEIEIYDDTDEFNKLHDDSIKKLPYTLYTMFGFNCEVTLK